MARIEIANVRKTIGQADILKGIDLAIDDREFVVIVGPSGCGKSTLLRILCGLDEPSVGTLHFDGRDVTKLSPVERSVGMVFQSYALYPQLTVRGNLSFGLKIMRTEKAEIDRIVDDVAARLQISHLLDRRPLALSGGQRQRVAIGRALVKQPKVFLFDEPLSNLDAALRSDTRMQIAELHRTSDATTVYVTHDQIEAMTLATKIVVLKDGGVMQVGTPEDIYSRPNSVFVAQFIGSPKMNLAASGNAEFADLIAQFRKFTPFDRGYIGFRPETVTVTDVPDRRSPHFKVLVSHLENLGSEKIAIAKMQNGETVFAKLASEAAVRPRQSVYFNIDLERCHFFGEDQKRLSIN